MMKRTDWLSSGYPCPHLPRNKLSEAAVRPFNCSANLCLHEQPAAEPAIAQAKRMSTQMRQCL